MRQKPLAKPHLTCLMRLLLQHPRHLFITDHMASKLGPFFAILAKANNEWTASLKAQSETQVVVECENKALIVEVFNEKFRKALASGHEGWIFLAQILREDEEILFAFEDARERTLFEELREIDGIGPKSAAVLIGRVGLDGFRKLVMNPKDLQTLKIPGMGSKSLEKVSLGLKQKQESFLQILGTSIDNSQSQQSFADEVPAEIEKALMQLGLKPFEVRQVFQSLSKENPEALDQSIETLLPEALKIWGRMRASRNPLGTKNSDKNL